MSAATRRPQPVRAAVRHPIRARGPMELSSILIIDDDTASLARLVRLVSELLTDQQTRIHTADSLGSADRHTVQHALMPFEHLLPEPFRGRNQRLGDTL